MFTYQAPIVRDELRNYLAATPFNRLSAVAAAGVAVEAALDRLTFLYRCSVPRTRDNAYNLGELLGATAGLFKKLELTRTGVADGAMSDAPVRPAEIVARLKPYAYLRNTIGAHYNPVGFEISDADARTFVALAIELIDALSCPSCGQMPSKTTGTQFRCSCHGVLMAPLELV